MHGVVAVCMALGAVGARLGDVVVDAPNFANMTYQGLGRPLLNGAEVLIPASIAISSVHKLMEHRETSGSLLIELITKGGGTLLIIELLKNMIAASAG